MTQCQEPDLQLCQNTETMSSFHTFLSCNLTSSFFHLLVFFFALLVQAIFLHSMLRVANLSLTSKGSLPQTRSYVGLAWLGLSL